MKQTLLVFLTLCCCFSCKEPQTVKSLGTASIESFTIDSISIRAIYPVSTQEVYFAGSNGAFGHTNDSGKTWTTKSIVYQDSIVPNFRSIASNGKDFFALSIGSPALLYKIVNGNATVVYTETHPAAFYDSMQFFDNLHGIAMGDPTDGCLSVIRTADGGNTWKKIPCSKLPKAAKGEAAFAASNTNIAIVNNTAWMVSGGAKSRVYISTNKGEDWEAYNTPIIQGKGSQGIYSVDFYDEKNGIVVGGDYANPTENKQNKAITTDGGRTWQLVADGINPSYKSCVQYIPGSQDKGIIAVGKTGVSLSKDGGKHWQEISKEPFYSIQFVDTHTAWLSGHQRMGKLTFSN